MQNLLKHLFKMSILSSAILSCNVFAQQAVETTQQLATIVVTAEEQVKQSLGVSVIDKEDLANTPVRNDISEYVRRMPGVNLTGNNSGGQRGNNRQIDIRGMGPENTLIMVDGRPINSRNAVRYAYRGERDTRGDSNWIPSDAIESIEVLRGPAAARYGSGAMGGVVNIKTKKVSNEVHGSVDLYTNQPENKKEGDSNRISATLSLPLVKDVISMRIYGNFNKTDADAVDINPVVVASNGSRSRAAGREGVKNTDGGLRLGWQINEKQSLTFDGAYGRQSNIYSGDTQNSNLDASLSTGQNTLVNSLVGSETNRMERTSYALTHDADWNWASSKIVAQYDKTKNRRNLEGLYGGPEGRPTSANKSTAILDTYRVNGELSIPLNAWRSQHLTLGAEYVEDKFHDSASTSLLAMDNSTGVTAYLPSVLPSDRSHMKSRILSAYAENNIQLADKTNVVLALRVDDHNKSGVNWSPSINITQKIGDYWTIKGGVARAYKAPNMYQNAEGYLLYTRGNGCPTFTTTGNCYLLGSANLKPETSINSELGVQFDKDIWNASLTYFRNDYKNKIGAGDNIIATVNNAGNRQYPVSHILRWENIPKALVQGVEGSVGMTFDNATWTNNITYMIDSKDKSTGNPLSIIPNYTINSIFNYRITDNFDVNFVYTQYGRQKPRQFAIQRSENRGINSMPIKSYGIASINVGYKFTDNISGRIGVSNIFDEQKLRDNSVNQSYNEAGRAYYANLKYTF